MCNVFGFGSAAVDFRINVPEMGEGYRDKLLAQEIKAMGGGAMANCLTQLSRLGGKAFWLGKLGTDWIAGKIIEQMKEEDIDCSCIIRDLSVCSPFNVAVYAGQHNRRVGGFLLPNSLDKLKQEDIELLASNVGKKDWVVIELGEISLNIVLSFCMLVKERGAHIAMDVDLDPVKQCGASVELVDRILALADVLIPNITAVQSFFTADGPKGLARSMSYRYKAVTVVTAGADGVYYCVPEGDVVHKAVESVDVVDTVGAGDAFHGGMLYALAHNWTLDEAVKLGIKCGGMNCTKFGARTGMPYASDVGISLKGM